MSDGTPLAEDAARLREQYEGSLSWRVTKPLRAAGDAVRRLRKPNRSKVPAPVASKGKPPATPSILPGGYDSWLSHYFGEELAELDRACAGAGPEALALFAGLDDDLWALLLSREYESYPNIRALLPGAPEADLQLLWNGASGLELLSQSKAFYAKARDGFREHSGTPLQTARVLDFGCGWGRVTRFFARDITPGSLCGCDPVQSILDVCAETRVPATLRRSEFVPDALPFEEPFDLVFSFSVFTHLSEPAHERCLRAIHAALAPGGLLMATIRPPAYLELTPWTTGLVEALGSEPMAALAEPRYLFVAHTAGPEHHQYDGGEMHYGESVISLPYVRERWGELFELLNVGFLTGDMHQVVVTLRRRD